MTKSSTNHDAQGGAALTIEIGARDGDARRGVLRTRRGDVQTPAFMPVGTAGSVKGLLPDEVESLGAEIVLANVRPGENIVRTLGGIHEFSGWPRPVLTDSGGYQVFSLAELRTLDDDGVTFKDHVDGTTRRLTPEMLFAGAMLRYPVWYDPYRDRLTDFERSEESLWARSARRSGGSSAASGHVFRRSVPAT